jgi:hypothetical protein
MSVIKRGVSRRARNDARADICFERRTSPETGGSKVVQSWNTKGGSQEHYHQYSCSNSLPVHFPTWVCHSPLSTNTESWH